MKNKITEIQISPQAGHVRVTRKTSAGVYSDKDYTPSLTAYKRMEITVADKVNAGQAHIWLCGQHIYIEEID